MLGGSPGSLCEVLAGKRRLKGALEKEALKAGAKGRGFKDFWSR